MSEFNKEQLVIFINNLFIVIGGLFTYHTVTKAYDYYIIEQYGNMSTQLAFGLSVGTISSWLLFTAIKKGIDEFIKAGGLNNFNFYDVIKQLEMRIENTNREIATKKKALKMEDEEIEESETEDKEDNEK